MCAERCLVHFKKSNISKTPSQTGMATSLCTVQLGRLAWLIWPGGICTGLMKEALCYQWDLCCLVLVVYSLHFTGWNAYKICVGFKNTVWMKYNNSFVFSFLGRSLKRSQKSSKSNVWLTLKTCSIQMQSPSMLLLETGQQYVLVAVITNKSKSYICIS